MILPQCLIFHKTYNHQHIYRVLNPLGFLLEENPQHFLRANKPHGISVQNREVDFCQIKTDSVQEDYFKTRIKKLNQESSIDYDPNNINEKRLINMIVKHDDNVQNNKPHPKTEHQLLQQQIGIDKQQELQAQKKPNNDNANN